MPENKSSESYGLGWVFVHQQERSTGVCAVGPGCAALYRLLSLSGPRPHLKLLSLQATQMRLGGWEAGSGRNPGSLDARLCCSVGISSVNHLRCDSGRVAGLMGEASPGSIESCCPVCSALCPPLAHFTPDKARQTQMGWGDHLFLRSQSIHCPYQEGRQIPWVRVQGRVGSKPPGWGLGEL